MNSRAVYLAYYVSILLFVMGTIFPEGRVWAFNTWSFLPEWFGAAATIALVAVPLWTRSMAGQRDPQTERSAVSAPTGARNFAWLVIIASAAATLLFIVFRTRTHFLGDGWGRISDLAQGGVTAILGREIGESLVHSMVYHLLGAEGEGTAIVAFRIVSVVSGCLVLLLAAYFAARLFKTATDRWLFWAATASGGYMLLAFGYVENYSLLMVAAVTFTLVGLMVSRGQAPWWSVWPPFFVAVFFHILGIVLLPAAIFLSVARTSAGAGVARWSTARKLASAAILIGPAAIALWAAYTKSSFFQLAIVPLRQNRFAVQGYTMFSAAHLLDFLNLVFILCPALLVIAVGNIAARRWREPSRTASWYAIILTGASCGAAFILDPKLGVPRDWDLFCLAGIPLIVLGTFSLLQARTAVSRQAAALAIVLSVAVLLPRVWVQASSERAIDLFKSYTALDIKKSRVGVLLLRDYYGRLGDRTAAASTQALYNAHYPEDAWADTGMVLTQKQDYAAALPYFEKAVRENPMFSTAWGSMGLCLTRLGLHDSARVVLEHAIGLNPHSGRFHENLALALLGLGDEAGAEKALVRAAELDPSAVHIVQALVSLYRSKQRWKDYEDDISRLDRLPDSLPQYSLEYGDYLSSHGRFEEAAAAYSRALTKGIPRSEIETRLDQFPALKTYIH